MRIWSELFVGGQHEHLIDNKRLFRDYNCEIGIPVKEKTLKRTEDFVKEMYRSDVDVILWPLNGSFGGMWLDDYWVNCKTAGKTVELVKKTENIAKNTNVEAIALDMESMPFVEYLMDKEKARAKIENQVDIVQKDWKKDVISMQWYWDKASKIFNLPIPRNANRNLYMTYTSMSLTSAAPQILREKFIARAVDDGIGKYRKIDVDIGATHTGVYEKVFYPLCKAFVYNGPKKMKTDIDFAKSKGASSVGAYSIDGMGKNPENWLKVLTI
jgi:hypothetical protein